MISREWVDKDDLIGKVCLVTGGTSGIGKSVALSFAEFGADVVITARNKEKAEKVIQEIREISQNENVDYLIGDFSDLDQVRGIAKEFISKYKNLHILVNNAGAFYRKREETKYNVEKSFLVNHLSPFLLTNLLLDLLKKSKPSKIINISSDSHRRAKIDLNNLNMDGYYSGIKAYSNSKLANLLFTYELSRKVENKTICVNSVHPGFVSTGIFNFGDGLVGKVVNKIINRFMIKPEEGADTVIYLALSRENAVGCGKYFINRKSEKSSDMSYDLSLAKELWEKSEELTNL